MDCSTSEPPRPVQRALDFLQSLNTQLRVAPEIAFNETLKILGGDIQCSLGGQYETNRLRKIGQAPRGDRSPRLPLLPRHRNINHRFYNGFEDSTQL